MEKLHERLRTFANSDHAINLVDVVNADSANMKDIALAIADEIERDYTPKRTCYEAIKEMSFEDLGDFIFRVYNRGWSDARNGVDDEAVFSCTMLEYSDTFLDEDWDELD